MPERPLVGIVVVNFNGGDLTVRCLQRLHELTWPAERTRIVLVDNGSHDGIPDAVRQRWPDVIVIETGRNLGFGGACNRGFEVLTDVDYVALVNNDAMPEADWLEPLVDALESDARLGAATPKVLLTGSWVELHIESAASHVPGDPRLLGVQVGAVLVGGTDRRTEVLWRRGVWGPERTETPLGPTFQWTDGHGVALVPAPSNDEIGVAVAATMAERQVVLRCGAATVTTVTGGARHPQTVTLVGLGPGCAAINNVGVVVLPDGSAADRGYLEIDDGQFDNEADVEAWSGAAVLLRRRFLDEVGGFDEALFLYYEDVDLSLRGRARGWRYRYVPTSIVHHHHSATVGSVPDLVRHLSARNRLIILTRHAERRIAFAALREAVATAIKTLRIDVIAPKGRGEPASYGELRRHSRVLAGYAKFMPSALGYRAKTRPRGRPSPICTERADYTERLLGKERVRWKRALDVQRPYRWNIRRLALGRTLDVGCGIGRNLAHLDDAVGVDHNAESVAVCRQRGYLAYTPAEFEETFRPNDSPAFDTLLLSHVVEHMTEAEAVSLIATYLPYLRPGGKVILITPQPAGYRSDPTHIRYVDPARARDLLSLVGASPVTSMSFPFPRLFGSLFRYNEFVTVGQLSDLEEDEAALPVRALGLHEREGRGK